MNLSKHCYRLTVNFFILTKEENNKHSLLVVWLIYLDINVIT